MPEALPAPVPGTCYKFVVRAADEAAALIREQLGPHARVLSVRTVEASGLSSLWSAPRLEVIAQIDAPPPSAVVGRRRRWRVPAPVAVSRPRRAAPPGRSLPSLLRRSGLSELALGRLQAMPGWEALQAAPLHRALVETGAPPAPRGRAPPAPAWAR